MADEKKKRASDDEIDPDAAPPRPEDVAALGDFDVVKKSTVAEPKPASKLPQPLEGEVEVVDYRKTGPVDVTGQVPDPFTKLRRIGVVDTTFSRTNMGDEAEDVL